MKALLSRTGTALRLTLLFAVICGGAYPLLVLALAQTLFPDAANGFLLRDPDGTVRGSRLLGQGFQGDAYFHPRPSAAGDGYDGAASGGSNLGPTSKTLADQIAERVGEFRRQNHLDPHATVPADAVTASGSGLDPHISPANARLQMERVARAREIPGEILANVVARHSHPATLGFLGDPRVDVLGLNRDLDQQFPAPPRAPGGPRK